MKIKTLIFVLTGLFAIAGCSSKDKSGSIPAVGTIVADIDGKEWKSLGANALRQTVQGGEQISAAGTVIIDLSTNNLEVLTITFVSDVGGKVDAKDYVVQNGLPYFQVTFGKDVNAANQWFSKSGQATITKVEQNNIQGTFSATLERQGHPDIVVTNGRFNTNIMNP